jgi:leader peptidase (prepilin peptidase) / N-methyltransferase
MALMSGFTVLLILTLGAISVVDMKEMRIPDMLNGMLLAGGISFWILRSSSDLGLQAFSALALASALWLIRYGHSKVSGEIGLGLGDVKMAGAGAVWISPLSLPMFLFVASASGLAYAVLRRAGDRQERMPFAPFLSFGLLSCWIAEYYL